MRGLRSLLVVAVACSLFTVAAATAAGWTPGYARSVSGEVIGYQSPYPGPTPALLVRTTDGAMAIEWETAPAPTPVPAGGVDFVVMCGTASGYGAHRFDLFVDGRRTLSFTSAKDTKARDWRVEGADGISASFRTTLVGHFDEMFGFLLLHVPAARLTPGAPLRLRAVGEKAGSQDYFMVFERTPASAIDCRAEQALVRAADGPRQVVRVDVSHIAPPADATLEAEGAAPIRARLETGFNTFDMELPSVEAPRTVTVRVAIAGAAPAAVPVELAPVAPREYWLLPHSHLDVGYSDPQATVERKQVENVRHALAAIARTSGYPEAARFAWTAEAYWPVEKFLAGATAAEREALGAAVRAGSFDITALYTNTLTGLCAPEELERLVEPACTTARELGGAVRSAMITDIPGVTWPAVTALAQAGVRYFASAPNYMPFLPDRGDRVGHLINAWGDRPFWWVSPSRGEKILFWVAGHGYSWFHGMNAGTFGPQTQRALLDYAHELSADGYPYAMVQVNYTVGGDNGPVDDKLPDNVRAWNERFISPRLLIANATRMFAAFEARYGAAIPAVAGDLSPYWEDGAASSARETADNRASVQRLITAETIAALAPAGAGPARPDWDAGWRAALMFDEHTWGAWNSVSDPDEAGAVGQWTVKQAFAREADARSRALLDAALAARGPAVEGAVDVINTLSWPRGGVVLVPAALSSGRDRATLPGGAVLVSQRLASGDLALLVPQVPAFSSLRVTLSAGPTAMPASPVRATATALENTRLQLALDPDSGAIASLARRAAGAHDLAGPGGLNGYLYVAGRDPRAAQPNGKATLTLVDRGPLVATLRATSAAPGARALVRDVRLTADADTVEIADVIDKAKVREKEAVHVAFPFAVEGGAVRVDLGGALVTPDRDQLPGACRDFLALHAAADVSNADEGVSLAALDAPLVEFGALTDETLREKNVRAWRTAAAPGTALYSYALNNYWHTNYKADQDGAITLRYALRPHAAEPPDAVTRFGLEQLRPLVVAPAAGPGLSAPLAVEPAGVLVTSLRRSAEGTFARLYNASGAPQTVQLTGTPRFQLAPQAVATVRLP